MILITEKEKHLKTLFKGSTIFFSGTILGKFLNFLYRTIIARYLGPTEYGLFSLGLMFLGIGTTISLLGFQTALKRYIPEYWAKENLKKIKGTLIFIFSIVLIISSLITLITFNFSGEIAINIFKNKNFAKVLKIFVLVIPISALLNLLQKTFISFKKMKYEVLIRVLSNGVFVLVSGLIVILLGGEINHITYSYLLSLAAGAFIGIFILEFKIFPLIRTKIKSSSEKKKLISFSLPLFLSSSVGLIMLWSDTFMIGVFLKEYSVGLYNAAYPLGMAIGMFVPAFGSIFVPIASELYSKNKLKKISEIFSQSKRWLFLITLPIFVFILFFSKNIMLAFFGKEYVSAYIVLIIISFCNFFMSIVGPTTELLQVFEKVKYLLIFNTIGALGNIFLNFLLIPKLGIIGASLAFVASLCYVNIMYLFKCRKQIKISFKIKEYLPATIISLACGCISYFLFILIEKTSPTWIIIPLSVLYLILYISLLIFTKSLNKKDIILLEEFEKRIDVKLTFIKKYIKED